MLRKPGAIRVHLTRGVFLSITANDHYGREKKCIFIYGFGKFENLLLYDNRIKFRFSNKELAPRYSSSQTSI